MLRAATSSGPQARDRCFGVADVDGELLVAPGFLVLVDRVRRHEIDPLAVGRPLPRAHAGRVLGDLLRDRAVGKVPRQRVELFFAALARAERDPASVVTEREIRHALFRIRDPVGLAAVGTHHVELIARRGALRRFAVREEDEEASVARPPWRRLVLLLGERHLLRRRHALLERHQVDVGLPLRLLPVRSGQRIQHPLAVGTGRLGGDLTHLLHVEEGHRPRARRLRPC